MIKISEGLCFDDVLLKPKKSNILSRADVDLSVKINDFTFTHPFVPANMKTIMGFEMAEAVFRSGGLTLIHRFMPIEEQLNIFATLKFLYANSDYLFNLDLKDPSWYVGMSVGIKKEDRDIVDRFVTAGVKILCIDIAHAHSTNGLEMTSWIKNKYPEVLLIVGSIATGEAAKDLWLAGADICKTNIGAGSICSTRGMTGNGVPQLSALLEVSAMKQIMEKELNRKLYIMSDGGMTTPGCAVKALCAGADVVMSGNLFAGCDETPGESKMIDGILYKQYHGSSTHRSSASHVEGVKSWVVSKGNFGDILFNLCEHLQSGCSYQNAQNLEELKRDPEFIKISSAGLKESQIHNVLVE